MRPLYVLMSVEEAQAILMNEIKPVEETEMVSLREACGRVMAEDIVADVDVPAFDRAAMDGYAVQAHVTVTASEDSPVSLPCTEYLYAGTVARQVVSDATCSEIATGAPLPDGADAVIMVEQTRKHGVRGAERIELLRPVRPGQHVTRRGTDMTRGEIVMQRGTVITPARVGAIAAVGRASVTVYRRPRVAVGATGNEVVEPGGPLAPGQVYNINSYTLAALFESLGCDVDLLPVSSDDIGVLENTIRSAQAADLVVLSGGSSVGERDVLQDAFSNLGEILFHGIAIKPGKPTMLARIAGTPVVGMPGYPTSCLSNGYHFLAPAIDRLAHRPPSHRATARVVLREPLPSMADKYQLYPVRLTDGQAAAAFKESGAITSLSRADGFVAIPVGVERLEAGQEVEVTLL